MAKYIWGAWVGVWTTLIVTYLILYRDWTILQTLPIMIILSSIGAIISLFIKERRYYG